VRILSFSYCFPNVHRPQWGVFVAQRLAALARQDDVSLEVVAPVPTFPLLSRLRSPLPPEADHRLGLDVFHPRFFYVPGMLKDLDGAFYARGLRPWLKRHVRRSGRPDLLDAHFAWPDGVGVATLARQMGIPYAVTLRGKLYPSLDEPAQRRQVAAALFHAEAVISVSTPMAEEAIALGAAPQRVHVIPNGIDPARFQPGDRTAARRELGLPEDAELLVTVAHLGPRKGHREVIGALAELPEDVHLVLVGGERHTGRDARDLQQLADRLGVGQRVHIVGPQPYEKIPLYFAAADASVLASYREGCPNVVLESLAAGRPVAATDVGAVADLIEPGRSGRLMPARNAAATAEAIRAVLAMDTPPEEIRSTPSVQSWDAVARRVRAVFEDVLERSGPLQQEPSSTEAL
jgi:glycosyltransferase involved in cell wall biosynthesis